MINNKEYLQKLTFSKRLSDKISEIGGSWHFIIFLILFLVVWMLLNAAAFFVWGWDPYPFILLNLFLSCLATFQAPIILMAQNRAAERDRHQADRDHAINRKAEREVENMQADLDEIKLLIRKHHKWLKEEHHALLLNKKINTNKMKKKYSSYDLLKNGKKK